MKKKKPIQPWDIDTKDLTRKVNDSVQDHKKDTEIITAEESKAQDKMVGVQVRISPQHRRKAKIKALHQDITLREYIEKLIDEDTLAT